MPTNTDIINHLEYNKDRIVAGYIKAYENQFKKDAHSYGPLDFEITHKYSRTRIPGVQLGNVVAFTYEKAIYYADLAGGWQEHYKTFIPYWTKKRYPVVAQSKHFVVIRLSPNVFSVVHILSRWAIAYRVYSQKCCNEIMAAMEEYGFYWNFTSYQAFHNDIPDDIKEKMLADIKRILKENNND